METGLAGRCALVMGAGSGLGAAVALELAAEGARVAAVGRSADGLADTARQAAERGVEVLTVQADLTDPQSVRAAVDRVVDTLGPIEILFNNSGGPAAAGALEVAPQTWQREFDTMVLSLIRLTELVVPGMRARGWGRVITCASSGVVAPIPGLAVSNGLRPALVGWSKTLAGEVAADGITVNVVLPGRIATRRTRELDEGRARAQGSTVQQVQAQGVSRIPVGRYGRPEEFSAAVVFLASERASFVTGSVLRVDGGMVQSV